MEITRSLKNTIRIFFRTTDKVQIKFTKADGSIRTMNCTLNSKVIPADKMPVSTEVKEIATEPTEPKEDTVCKIYDLESEAWRSFKWDSLLSISYTFE